MRNFEQVKDIITYSEDIHERLSELYHSLNEQNQKQKIKMLLEYLERHEINLADSIRQYESDAAQSIMNQWLQYKPSAKIEGKIKLLPVKPDLSLQEVVDIALNLDETLIELYQDVIEQIKDPEVVAVFQNLIDMENAEKKRMVRDALMLNEL